MFLQYLKECVILYDYHLVIPHIIRILINIHKPIKSRKAMNPKFSYYRILGRHPRHSRKEHYIS